MKAIILATALLLLIACGGVRPITLDFHLPDLNTDTANDAQYTEGWNCLKKGDVDTALKLFQRSEVRLDKKHVAFGYVFLARKKFSAASLQFLQALEMNPDNLEAGIGLATIYEAEGKKTEAFQYYGNLLNKAPDNTWIKLRYDYIKSTATQECLKQAESFKNTDQKEYVQALQRAAYFSPEMIAIKIQIGDYFFQTNEFAQAIPYYETALEIDFYNQDVLLKLAAIYEKSKKFDLALMTLDRLLAIRPGDPFLESEKKRIRDQFQELNLPEKFKKIFFKTDINREELAALIGYYFDSYIQLDREPEIITDIDGSFARDYIIKICSNGIMGVRPDHSFDRFANPDRASFAVILNALIQYMEKKGRQLHFTPLATMVESIDLSPLHKNYETIKFLINVQILSLDADGNFSPTRPVSPADVISSLKKILNSIAE